MEEIQPTFMANPSNIWFIYKPDTLYETLLTNAMQEYVVRGRREGRSSWYIPKVQEVVMLWIQKGKIWCRAQITKLFFNSIHQPSSSVVAFLLDYGTSVDAMLGDVQAMPADPRFQEPGRASKLVFSRIVPITKKTCFSPDVGLKLVDVYSEKWDRSTYDLMAKLLSTNTKFYLEIDDYKKGKTTYLGNKVYHGDLLMLVGEERQSIRSKLAKDKYGLMNFKLFKEMFAEPDAGMPGLLSGPAKPIDAQPWQKDVLDLLGERENVEMYDLPTEEMDPFAPSAEEVEAHERAVEAKAAKAKAEAEAIEARANLLLNEKLKSEELKKRLCPVPFAQRLKMLKEQQKLTNSARELAGVVPVWEKLTSDVVNNVFYRTTYNPSNIFVMLTENNEVFKTLQEEINSFSQQHQLLVGQVVPRVGAYCIALFQEDKTWYRAQITSLLPNHRMEVFFLDVGDKGEIDGYTEILPISRHLMTTLPFQGIECSLYGIQPSDGRFWEDEATDLVVQYCLNDDQEWYNLHATLYTQEQAEYSGGSKYKVVLTRLDRQDSLNNALLQLSSVKVNINELIPTHS